MREVWIVGAARTAIGSFGGSLKEVPAPELGAVAIRAALERAGVRPDQVDEALMGCVLAAAQGQNPARQAALQAGIPVECPASTVNMVCGSGLRAVLDGARGIMAGQADIVIAGGMESMSRAVYASTTARWGSRTGHQQLEDTMIRDGLMCAVHDVHMGVTAENIAEKYGIAREEQDAFALLSQQRAAAADFSPEIAPVHIRGKKEMATFDRDEYIRPSATAEALSKLRPVFKPDGSVTAGNASGLNDGAAALVLCSGNAARALDLKPLGRLAAFGMAGVDPAMMGVGPVGATRKALANAGWRINELDLIEANEAFAAQSIAIMRELGLPSEKTNTKGGAIALGHPIGASGARILVTLLYAMRERGARKGLATLCIGGGMGIAALVERP